MTSDDEFKPLLNERWELTDEDEDEDEDVGIDFCDRAKIELMFYEQEGGTPFPNKASVAGASVLETWTQATGRQTNDEAIKETHHVLIMRWHNNVDVDEPDWWKLADPDCKLPGESDESDEEGSDGSNG